jgi:hypothetical protein
MSLRLQNMTVRCQRCRETFTPLIPLRLEEDDARGLPVLCETCRYGHQAKGAAST